ncbi:glucose-induced degradation protein 8 homolog [Zophobas morio]|uniref:glucose-induced degradation protein 8 homolog n=1 Tax=Zophobas morio TaxID=2755281 RepID=UPI003083CB58
MEDWNDLLKASNVKKKDLNLLVLNYLVTEGYKDSAVNFMQEAGIPSKNDIAFIERRKQIRNSIQNGDVKTAVEILNDLDPEILDTDPQLFFLLQQQKLIELIRDDNVLEALRFASEELDKSGAENEAFLEELEKTMSLLAFKNNKLSPVGYLLDMSQRQKIASQLNSAILASQAQEKNPKLPLLIKMLFWSQEQLSEKISFPVIKNIYSADLHESKENSDGESPL